MDGGKALPALFRQLAFRKIKLIAQGPCHNFDSVTDSPEKSLLSGGRAGSEAPGCESLITAMSVFDGGDKMSASSEGVVDGGMDGLYLAFFSESASG